MRNQNAVIDLNDAVFDVVLLSGTLNPSDSFTLFDFTGGTTLTGDIQSIGLPGGVWDTSDLAVDGTMTYVSDANVYSGETGSWNIDTWNNAANWSTGVPNDSTTAVIDNGEHASVQNVTPAYSGDLILSVNATLQLAQSSEPTMLNALGGGTITMHTGSDLTMRYTTSSTHPQDIVMAGDAVIALGRSTSAHNVSRALTGSISGNGKLTVHSTNNNRLLLQGDNSGWAGGLLAGGDDSENKKETIEADATHSLGTGDITINEGLQLQIDAVDAMGDEATLMLDGVSRSDHPAKKLLMNAADTVGMLVRNGFPYPAGTYGKVGSGAANEVDWIDGNARRNIE